MVGGSSFFAIFGGTGCSVSLVSEIALSKAFLLPDEKRYFFFLKSFILNLSDK